MNTEETLSKAEREYLISRTRTRCFEALGLNIDAVDDYSVMQKREVNNAMRRYPDRTHRLIDAYFNSTERAFERGLMAEIIQKHDSIRVVNEFATYSPALLGPDNSQYEMLILAILNGIRNYTQLPAMKDYSYATPLVREQIMALLTATTIIEFGEITHAYVKQVESKDEHPAFKIVSDPLTELLMERPNAAEEIAKIVLEWKTDDPELITNVLDSNTPALRDGTL